MSDTSQKDTFYSIEGVSLDDMEKDQTFVFPSLLDKTIVSLHRVKLESIVYDSVIVLLCSDGEALSLVSTQGGLLCLPVESFDRVPMGFPLPEGEATILQGMETPEVSLPLRVASIRASFCHFEDGESFPFNFSLREDKGKALFFDCEGDELHLMRFEDTVDMLCRVSRNTIGEIRTLVYSFPGVEV